MINKAESSERKLFVLGTLELEILHNDLDLSQVQYITICNEISANRAFELIGLGVLFVEVEQPQISKLIVRTVPAPRRVHYH